MILLVIGASSDMGIALIRRTHKKYERIIAHYNHMSNEVKLLAKEIGEERIIFLHADLTVEDEVIEFINRVKRICRCPDHIVHFPAPACYNTRFPNIKWEVFQREYEICLKSAVLILQEFLPLMAKNHYGRILIILSYVVNNVAPAYCCNYVVNKYAMLGLVKALATEYASKGITINGISPAWVNTKYVDNQPDVLKEQIAVNSPIGRILEVSEVTPTMEFLLSEGASCINGENITISCGR